MRISDWSSDVCSSDLGGRDRRPCLSRHKPRDDERRADRRTVDDPAGGGAMMAESLLPGEAPVSLNEARGWLRLGATIDDAVVAQLVRAATNICEAFIGQWLVVRDGEEVAPLRSEEHTSELQSLMRISYAVFCLQKK